MKGLKEYIAKYGEHFTEELAEKASSMLLNRDNSSHCWKADKIEELIEKRVYYNITSSTLGDIVYMVNFVYANYFPNIISSRSSCIDRALEIMQDTDAYEGMSFVSWLHGIKFKEKDFDFNKYI